jgi:hypothetical protein
MVFAGHFQKSRYVEQVYSGREADREVVGFIG